jgi:endoglucanase
MKRFFLLHVILFSAALLCAQPVKEHGALSVNGVLLTDIIGRPVTLHGVSFGWHNWWPRFYNENTVKWLAGDWKCTVVRAAMGVEPAKGFIQDPAGSKEKIEAVINAAIANDIYVLIDWHSHGLRQKEAVDFFAEMAQKYGTYPNVIYEIFNEPDKNSWSEVKNYSIEVIKKIREYDPDNVILVGCPHWDQDIHLVADDPIQGFSNLMYTVHFYAATHGKSLRDRSDYALSKGVPIFVSECAGMSANGDGPIDYAAWTQWTEWMDKNSISWIAWSVSDKNESCSMLYPSASSTGKWKEKDMREWGIKTRGFLRSYGEKE